jgi:hypothetical protein
MTIACNPVSEPPWSRAHAAALTDGGCCRISAVDATMECVGTAFSTRVTTMSYRAQLHIQLYLMRSA